MSTRCSRHINSQAWHHVWSAMCHSFASKTWWWWWFPVYSICPGEPPLLCFPFTSNTFLPRSFLVLVGLGSNMFEILECEEIRHGSVPFINTHHLLCVPLPILNMNSPWITAGTGSKETKVGRQGYNEPAWHLRYHDKPYLELHF